MQPMGGEAARSASTDTAKETAFVLNKREHWFSLRRIGREWFDLNSCLRTPRHYTDADLRFHIRDAALEGDSKKLVEAVQGCGRPGQGHSLFAGAGQRLDGTGGIAASSPATGSAPDAAALRAARLAR